MTLDELERLARAASLGPWYERKQLAGPFDNDDRAYIAAISPSLVLGLIEQLRAAARPADGEDTDALTAVAEALGATDRLGNTSYFRAARRVIDGLAERGFEVRGVDDPRWVAAKSERGVCPDCGRRTHDCRPVRDLLAMSDPALGAGEAKSGRCEDKLLDTDGHIYECLRFAGHEGPHTEGYAIDLDVDVERVFGNQGSASAVTFWTLGSGEELQC